MIGYGIIGCGYAGGIHASNLLKVADTSLTAVYDINRERAEEFACRYGGKAAASVEELCRDPLVQAVIITTPNNSHVLPALCAARAGKHVFCEKPAALNYKNTMQMIEAARENGVLFFSAHTTNFIQGVETAKMLVNSGKIGKLLMIEAVHTDWAGPQKEVGWKQKKEVSGGHLYHHMHEVDLICQLGGLPVSVFARGKNLIHHGTGFGDEEDAMFLNMELPGGGFASLTIGSAFHLGDHFVKLQGEKGGILLDFKNSFVRLDNGCEERYYSLQENEEEDEERRSGYRKNKKDAGKGFGKPGMKTSQWMDTIFLKELQCFNGAVKEGKPANEYSSLFGGDAAINCVKVLDGAMESICSGSQIKLEVM